jgi:hypothetical protein
VSPRFKGQSAASEEPVGEGDAATTTKGNRRGQAAGSGSGSRSSDSVRDGSAVAGLEWLDGVAELIPHRSLAEDWSDFRVSHSELRPEPPTLALHALASELWEAAVALGGAGVASQSAVAGRLGLLDALAASFALLPPKQMRARIAVVQAAIRGTGVTGAQADLEEELLSDREIQLEARAHSARVKNRRHRRAQEARMKRRPHGDEETTGSEEQADIHSSLASGHAQEALAMALGVLKARRKRQGSATHHGSNKAAHSHSMKLHGPREKRLAEQYAEYMDAAFRSGTAAEWLESELLRVTKRLQQVTEHGDRADLLKSAARRALGRATRESGGRKRSIPFVPVHARPPAHGGAAQEVLVTELQQRKNILESLTSDDRRKQLADWELMEKRRDAALAANGLVPFSEEDRQHADAVRKYGGKRTNADPQAPGSGKRTRDEL